MGGTLLSVKASAPGLPGPYLEENLVSYARLEALGDARVKTVLTLGMRDKDKFFKKLRIQPGTNHSVDIHYTNSRLFFLDAKIHLQPVTSMERIAGGPTPVHIRRHLLEHFNSPKVFGLELYSGVFFSVCDTTLVFMDELDVKDFASMLSFRVAYTERSQFNQANIVVVSARSTSDVYFDIVTTMQRSLQQYSGGEQLSFSEVKEKLSSSFEMSIVSHQNAIQSIEAIKSKPADKITPPTLKACHLIEMIKLSIKSLAQVRQAVSLIELSRQRYKVPNEISFSLESLISGCSSKDKGFATRIASALVVDAFPPGMHEFNPNMVFDCFYRKAITYCEGKYAWAGLAALVRTQFAAIALDLRISGISSIEYHRLVSQGNPSFKEQGNLVCCSLCLIRCASWAMQCNHQFCSACIVDCGTEAQSQVFSLAACPVCMMAFPETIDVSSALLGYRVLKISSLTGPKILSYLAGICRGAGIQQPTLCFDKIIAYDIGIFFAITLFLEKWSFAECQYHLRRVQYIKIDQKSVSFAKGLTWKREQIENNAEISLELCHKSHLIRSQKFVYEQMERLPCRVFQYDGDALDPKKIRYLSGQVLASLFYAQLLNCPRFPTSADVVRIGIKCRIPAGRQLMQVLLLLNRCKACIYYQTGKQPVWCERFLVEAPQATSSFDRTIVTTSSSIDDSISITLSLGTSQKFDIMNSPAHLSSLIDQHHEEYPFGYRGAALHGRNTIDKNQLERELSSLNYILHRCL